LGKKKIEKKTRSFEQDKGRQKGRDRIKSNNAKWRRMRISRSIISEKKQKQLEIIKTKCNWIQEER